MKKYLFSAIALSALLAGCSNDEAVAPALENQPVSFEIAGPVTRTVTTNNVTEFVEGDVIAITSSGLSTDMSNATYTVQAGGSLSGGSFYYNGEESATFYAHYPTTATYAAGSVAMSVPANQASEAAFNGSDFMTATATGAAATNSGKVSLGFKHRLALVRVVWNGTTTATAVTLNAVKPTATWTQADDKVATSGDAISVNTWKIGDGQEYWALIPAQTISANTQLLTITDASKSYQYTPQSDIEFTASLVKKITLNLNAEGQVEAVIDELSIEDWTEDTDNVNGNVEEVVVPPVELISAADFAAATLGTTVDGLTGMTTTGWAQVGAADNATITLAEGTLTLANKLTSSKWYNRAVVCRTEAVTTAAKYTLSFKLTTADKTGDGLRVAVMVPETTPNTFYKIGTSDFVYPTPDAAKTYTYSVDLSAVDTSTGVLLVLSPKTDAEVDVVYTVTDLTFVETREAE
ncbi:MAG: fimbrillin family protein [Bacteroides sp.]|nr:fimbrillin family protein [Bacteroides sp.]